MPFLLIQELDLCESFARPATRTKVPSICQVDPLRLKLLAQSSLHFRSISLDPPPKSLCDHRHANPREFFYVSKAECESQVPTHACSNHLGAPHHPAGVEVIIAVNLGSE
jgi:hypothetical protein